jgi:hypothetical protein
MLTHIAIRCRVEVSEKGTDMDTLTKEQRETWEDTYETNSPYYWTLVQNHGENLPYSVAERICRQHGTSVDALVAEGIITLVEVPTARPMVNTLDLVMGLGY